MMFIESCKAVCNEYELWLRISAVPSLHVLVTASTILIPDWSSNPHMTSNTELWLVNSDSSWPARRVSPVVPAHTESNNIFRDNSEIILYNTIWVHVKSVDPVSWRRIMLLQLWGSVLQLQIFNSSILAFFRGDVEQWTMNNEGGMRICGYVE